MARTFHTNAAPAVAQTLVAVRQDSAVSQASQPANSVSRRYHPTLANSEVGDAAGSEAAWEACATGHAAAVGYEILSPRGSTEAMTLAEVVLVVAIIIVLAAIVLPTLRGARQRQQRITCTSNLLEIGLVSRTWALDHGDLYPAAVPSSSRGAQQAVTNGEFFRMFQVMSNELATPRVLVCPADNRVRTSSFGAGFSNSNLSYFVGLDAVDTNPQMFLAGDRNLTNGLTPTNGTLVLATNCPAGWTHAIHRFQGNVALADGSVQQFSTSRVRATLPSIGAPQRLAMP